MEAFLLAVDLIVAIAMIVTILLQRSEGGGLGIGGGSGGLMSARGAGDLLSKTTKWLAIAFLSITLLLGWFASHKKDALDEVLAAPTPEVEKTKDTEKLPELPSLPEG